MVSDATKNYLDGLKLSKRARFAMEIMLIEGSVSTASLRDRHGLEHPPRAIRDLKDAGALVGSRNIKFQGKTIKEYFLEDIDNPSGGSPRNPITKHDKDRIIKAFDGRCAVCGVQTSRLQLDHRVPFAIDGDPPQWSEATGMPLCPSDNRAKSWACEHCENWTTRDPAFCKTCMWGSPDKYTHIAGAPHRRLIVTATKPEDSTMLVDIEMYSSDQGMTPSDAIMQILKQWKDMQA